jgi:hypothetical protein
LSSASSRARISTVARSAPTTESARRTSRQRRKQTGQRQDRAPGRQEDVRRLQSEQYTLTNPAERDDQNIKPTST